MAARYEVSESEELVVENETAIELPSQPPPSTATSDLRGSQSPGHHLPKGQSSQIAASLAGGDDNLEEEPELMYEQRAKEYKIWSQAAILASIIFCFFPFSLICLALAYFGSEETTKHNDEKDYISAKSCGICTLVWSIAAIVWGAMWGIGFIAFVAGVAS